MSITTIELTDNDISVTITRPDGSPLNVNGPLSGAFGVDSSGNAYFDTSGPTVGEIANLGWDGSVGEFFLDSRYTPDEHLMMLAALLRRWAPVTISLPDTGRSRQQPPVTIDSGVTTQPARAAARSRTATRNTASSGFPVGMELDQMQAARAAARAR